MAENRSALLGSSVARDTLDVSFRSSRLMNLLCIVPREDAERLALTAFRAASSMPGEVSFQSYAQNLQMPIALPASIPGL